MENKIRKVIVLMVSLILIQGVCRAQKLELFAEGTVMPGYAIDGTREFKNSNTLVHPSIGVAFSPRAKQIQNIRIGLDFSFGNVSSEYIYPTMNQSGELVPISLVASYLDFGIFLSYRFEINSFSVSPRIRVDKLSITGIKDVSTSGLEDITDNVTTDIYSIGNSIEYNLTRSINLVLRTDLLNWQEGSFQYMNRISIGLNYMFEL